MHDKGHYPYAKPIRMPGKEPISAVLFWLKSLLPPPKTKVHPTSGYSDDSMVPLWIRGQGYVFIE
jgi:hypothetical protein